jgi:pyruvate dehydrogenase E1 component alpha subunit
MKYSKEFLVSLYRSMLRIRFCEESLVRPILERKIHTPCHLYSGQEAIAVGICHALDKSDLIFGNHRSHGHYLAKGGSLKQMMAEIYCKEAGCSRGRGGSMHLIAPEVGMLGSAPIVAGTVSLGTGAALASSITGSGQVVVSFFGDGATGEGVIYESLNFAALQKLPIIFVCENNLYATHMPIRECRIEENIADIAKPFGVEAYTVEGNNVLAVHEAAIQAVDICRSGSGPVFLECKTYRLRGHVGPDDNIQGTHTDIRPDAEIKEWKKRDPLVLMRETMKDYVDVTEIEKLTTEIRMEVEEAHEYAKSAEWPRKSEVLNYVFA